MSTTINPQPHPADVGRIWPQSLPVFGVTGEYKAGKTLSVLSIDPANTLYYDTEKSAETYEALNLGFTRVDVWREMLRLYPSGHKPIDMFGWWVEQVKATPPGRYTVIALDTVSEIESGLCDWVQKNPGHFGHTAVQYARMEGIYWGDVKEHWKAILADLASRCQTFAFTAHMGDVWSKTDKSPTGKRKPKGKSTLMELASLYLQLERKPDKEGNEPARPSGIVLKSRLLTGTGMIDGEIVGVPTLPPRLPVATPNAIRQYMRQPAGGRATTEDERLRTEEMSADERLRLQAQIAEAETRKEELRLEQMQRQAEAKATRESGTRQKPGPAPTAAPLTNGTPATHPSGAHPAAMRPPVHATPEQTATEHTPTKPTDPATEAQLGELRHLYGKPAIQPLWNVLLEPHDVTSANELNIEQATKLIVKARQIAQLVDLKAELDLSAETWTAYLGEFGVTTALNLSETQANTFVGQLSARLADAQTKGGGSDAADAAAKMP